MARPVINHPLRTPTVELSIAATSEELALLSAAAQRKQMSLKDFLRLQLVSAAKAAAKMHLAAPASKAATAESELKQASLKPAFLP